MEDKGNWCERWKGTDGCESCVTGIADEKDDRALSSSREETSDDEINNGHEVPELIKWRPPGLFTSVDISASGREFWVVGSGVEDAGKESLDEKEKEETAEEEDGKHEGKGVSPM